jgi:hypothetical protein
MRRLTVILLLAITGLNAAPKVAIAVKAKGQVEHIYAETKTAEPLKRGAGLANEDIIRTGKNGFAVAMYLDDKTTIKVRENSEFLVGGERTATGINKRISLSYGTMFASVSKQKGKEFIIATPTSVAAVKGTEIVVISDPVLGDQFITLIGTIEVTNTATGESMTVNAGETANSTPEGTLDVTETDQSTVPDFEGEGGTGPAQHELRFELEDENGNIKTIIIQYQ